jgi:dynein heavy chain
MSEFCMQAILTQHLSMLNSSDVTDMLGKTLTDATLELYNSLLEILPPTPSRFHYVFNLRDLSRVYEGLLCSTYASCTSGVQMLRLWRNEVNLF